VKLFALLTLTFIACTVIGTLTHEAGHYLVAKGFGLSSSIHYAYVPFSPEIDDIADPAQRAWTRLAIRIGGPLQTILTGCLGLFLLRRSTVKRPIDDMPSTEQWIYIFLSLFWLRQMASLVVVAVQFFLLDHVSVTGDEAQIALSLGLPTQMFNVITGCIGALVLWYIIFRHVPSSLRLTFMSAGLVGGGIGYYLWLERIGPFILP
jgi:hypothetical protein